VVDEFVVYPLLVRADDMHSVSLSVCLSVCSELAGVDLLLYCIVWG
jgi:hypothetical protein